MPSGAPAFRNGQLARAAASIKVDPTTISRRLRRLEQRLGLTLFEQTREGQVLTEAGEAVLVEVEAMDLSAFRIREATDVGNGPAGTIRVSCSEGLGISFIAPRLFSFFEQYPSIKLDLVASNGFLSPSKREADIAIVLSRPSAGAVIASKLSDYALRLYAAKTYCECNPLRKALSRFTVVTASSAIFLICSMRRSWIILLKYRLGWRRICAVPALMPSTGLSLRVSPLGCCPVLWATLIRH